MRVIVFLGAPGSGKGTQASIIEKELNYKKISTGEILRAEITSNSKLGLELKQIVDSGVLVPDQVVIQIIENQITSNIKSTSGFIFDGYPRTIAQAEALDNMLAKLGLAVSKVLYLDIDQKKLIDRVSKRYSCKDCGENYNKLSKNTKIDGVCDVCGGVNFVAREDDSAQTLLKRLSEYNALTAPLLPYYEEKGLLDKIEADGLIADVTKEVNSYL